jgi:(2Fe-2S) ferredoxin
MEPFRIHLFVCTQQKPEGVPSCPANGSLAVLDALDREIQTRGLGSDLQLTTCGCMGLCEEGPVMVVYPEGVWYQRVQPSDIPEIVEQHLCDGKPVDRLIWNDASAMKAMSIEHGEHFRQAMAAQEKAGILPDRLNAFLQPLNSTSSLPSGTGPLQNRSERRFMRMPEQQAYCSMHSSPWGCSQRAVTNTGTLPSQLGSLFRNQKTTSAMVCCTPPISGIGGAH